MQNAAWVCATEVKLKSIMLHRKSFWDISPYAGLNHSRSSQAKILLKLLEILPGQGLGLQSVSSEVSNKTCKCQHLKMLPSVSA